MEDIQLRYNELLKRFYKAWDYLDNASDANADKWMPKFIEIVNTLNLMIEGMTNYGIKVTDDNIAHGFKEGR